MDNRTGSDFGACACVFLVEGVDMKKVKIATGLALVLLSMWGGTWLASRVAHGYELAAIGTAVLCFGAGWAVVARASDT